MIQITLTNTIHLHSLNLVKVTLLLPLFILLTCTYCYAVAGDIDRSSLHLNRQLNHQLPSSSSSSSSSASLLTPPQHFDIEKSK